MRTDLAFDSDNAAPLALTFAGSMLWEEPGGQMMFSCADRNVVPWLVRNASALPQRILQNRGVLRDLRELTVSWLRFCESSQL